VAESQVAARRDDDAPPPPSSANRGANLALGNLSAVPSLLITTPRRQSTSLARAPHGALSARDGSPHACDRWARSGRGVRCPLRAWGGGGGRSCVGGRATVRAAAQSTRATSRINGRATPWPAAARTRSEAPDTRSTAPAAAHREYAAFTAMARRDNGPSLPLPLRGQMMRCRRCEQYAAVYHEGLAVQHAGGVGAQVGDCGGDVVGGRDLAERRQPADLVA